MRADRQLCQLLFCENPLCSDTFESLPEYEIHLLSKNHTITTHMSSMDKIRCSYVTQMKATPQHLQNVFILPLRIDECLSNDEKDK